MKDMYLRLSRLSASKEDFLTECLAITLQGDDDFAEDFIDRVLGDRVKTVEKLEVKTQIHFPIKKSIIDMIIRVNDEFVIGVENKLGAPLGDHQLEKYLKLPIDGLVLITASYNYTISKKTLEDPIYIKPDHRDFFMWHDFYDTLSNRKRGSKSVFSSALKEMFEHYGFDPSPENIEDLHHPDEEVAKTNRKRFSKRWRPTIDTLKKRGWRTVHPGSVVELYVKNGKSEIIRSAWIDPLWLKNNLRVRITPIELDNIKQIKYNIEILEDDFFRDTDIEILDVDRTDGKYTVLDITISLKKLIDGLEGEQIDLRLKDHVIGIFDRINDLSTR